jgi:hypothetical protein
MDVLGLVGRVVWPAVVGTVGGRAAGTKVGSYLGRSQPDFLVRGEKTGRVGRFSRA